MNDHGELSYLMLHHSTLFNIKQLVIYVINSCFVARYHLKLQQMSRNLLLSKLDARVSMCIKS